jgi:hypothetical protein
MQGSLRAHAVGWLGQDVRDNSRVRVVAEALLEFFRCHEWMFLGQRAES